MKNNVFLYREIRSQQENVERWTTKKLINVIYNIKSLGLCNRYIIFLYDQHYLTLKNIHI